VERRRLISPIKTTEFFIAIMEDEDEDEVVDETLASYGSFNEGIEFEISDIPKDMMKYHFGTGIEIQGPEDCYTAEEAEALMLEQK
jgi:hypothetical protein